MGWPMLLAAIAAPVTYWINKPPASASPTIEVGAQNSRTLRETTSIIPAAQPEIKGTIEIDPGHSGCTKMVIKRHATKPTCILHDPGATTEYKGLTVQENELNFAVAQHVIKRLQELGYLVVTTHKELYSNHLDMTPEGAFTDMARYRASLAPHALGYFAIHMDKREHVTGQSFTGPDEGPMVNYGEHASPLVRNMANVIADNLGGEAVVNPRGIAVLGSLMHPATVTEATGLDVPVGTGIQSATNLIEVANLANTTEVKKIVDPAYQEQIGIRIADAIDKAISSPTFKLGMIPAKYANKTAKLNAQTGWLMLPNGEKFRAFYGCSAGGGPLPVGTWDAKVTGRRAAQQVITMTPVRGQAFSDERTSIRSTERQAGMQDASGERCIDVAENDMRTLIQDAKSSVFNRVEVTRDVSVTAVPYSIAFLKARRPVGRSVAMLVPALGAN